MRVLITGHTGQLGQALLRLRPDAIGVSRPHLELNDPASIAQAVQTHCPQVIVHCAAWTAVDEATRQPEQAYRVNALATHHLALAAAKLGATFVYLSTNEVFDGGKTTPYFEYDAANPINAYGFSKWAGEKVVQQTLSSYFIVRVSWLTGAAGRNFAHRVQQLADERGSLQIVADEVACPTFVHDLAPAIWRLVETGCFGIYHLVNEGYCSRFDFARHILDATGRAHIRVEPITSAQFQRASTPPKFAPLANLAAANLGITLPAWQDSLRAFFAQA
jgi:dTDP-4-dehydrorhamnose reductase